MKLFMVLVATLLYNAVSGQVICCGPYLDYQGYTDLYLGRVDLNLLPGAPPDAHTGLARLTSKFTAQMMKTEYVDWADIPGFDGVQAIVGDYRNNPGRIYDVFTNGSCVYTEYDNLFMTPACVPDTWTHVSTFYLGDNILVDRYGDEVNNNYVNVLNSNCLPIAQFATRRNAPYEGLYRFNTEFFTNITLFTGDIEIPEGCTPNPRPEQNHIEKMPLFTLSLKRQAPGEVFQETPKLRNIIRKYKTALRQKKFHTKPKK